jgi:hypothetical protein
LTTGAPDTLPGTVSTTAHSFQLMRILLPAGVFDIAGLPGSDLLVDVDRHDKAVKRAKGLAVGEFIRLLVIGGDVVVCKFKSIADMRKRWLNRRKTE